MDAIKNRVRIRRTKPTDLEAIVSLGKKVYPGSKPWTTDLLASHLRIFPQGQIVAKDIASDEIVGMAASLIVYWDDYDMQSSWRDFTDGGTFQNHDPAMGRTLYGAEVMVDSDRRGEGIGKLLYSARRRMTRRYNLRRIRAGARIPGYSAVSHEISPEDYVQKVRTGELSDATLTFQLGEGYQVLAVVRDYLRDDSQSCGYAAVIEWVNPHFKPEAV